MTQQQAPTEQRIAFRTNMFVMGALYFEGVPTPVRLRNMSVEGALVEGAALPCVGSKVRLCRGRLSLNGRVVWQSEGRAGIALAERAIPQEWLTGRSGSQDKVDQVVAQAKYGVSFARSVMARQKISGLSLNQLQGGGPELIREALQQVVDDLMKDPIFLDRHSRSAQSLDIIIEALRGVPGTRQLRHKGA